MPAPPLPIRRGLNPTRLVLPHDPGAVLRYSKAVDYLLARFPDDVARLGEKVASGEVVDELGEPITANTPYRPRAQLFLYRDLPADEPTVPQLGDIEVLFEDENLLVIDKPHFVAVQPRGAWVTQTALVYLRQLRDQPELSPAHRLDRLTAGVLVFTKRPAVRGAYQLLFERRQVHKEYLAIAPLVADGQLFPTTVRSRIVKRRGIIAAQQEPGPANAESEIDLLETDRTRNIGRYLLTPKTGRTHQLRMHLAALNRPILHDPFARFWLPDKPDCRAPNLGEPTQPLQLLADRLSFTDPITGIEHEFASKRVLSEWANPTPATR